MKILFIGDIYASPGRKVLKDFLPALKKKYNPDMTIANGENMAGGSGVTPQTYQEMMQCGVDLMTGGNHSFDKKEGYKVLADEAFCLRPANYPKGLPGRGLVSYPILGKGSVSVINLIGRTFMPPNDCPFRKADELIEIAQEKSSVIIVDFHAEASSEKMAMGWHLDGKVSLCVGTHTHIPTADERILPQGTAYITDLGMTGSYDSVIGVKKEIIVEKFLMTRGKKFETAKGNPWVCGVFAEIDEESGCAISIERIRVEADAPHTHP